MAVMVYKSPSMSRFDNLQSLQRAVHKLLVNITSDVLNV